MSSRSEGPLLVAEGLSKWYGGVRAVHDVSFTIAAGQVIGLVGPNGAGKTTLVDIITGTQNSDGGRLVLNKSELRGSAARRSRAGLARTFQHPLVPRELTIQEALVTGASAHRLHSLRGLVGQLLAGMVTVRRDVYAQAAQWAADFGLRDIDRLCGDVTLGELRLIEVVRAIAQQPSVLLLDEPFAGADLGGVEAISEGVRRTRGLGHAVILVDHNVDLVASLVDRIVLLDQGAVAFDGSPQECLVSDEMKRVYFGGRRG